MRRRGLLHLCAGTVSLTLAGCTELDAVLEGTDGGDGDAESGWSTFRSDASRSGKQPATAGPGDSIELAWEVTTEDILRTLHGVDPSEGPVPPQTSYISWPVLSSDHVIWTMAYQWREPGTNDDKRSVRILAADPADGTIEWSSELSTGEIQTSWFAPEFDGGRIYVPRTANDTLEMAVIDPGTGENLDRLALDLPFTSGQPLVTDGTIHVAAAAEDVPTLYALSSADAAEEWSQRSGLKRTQLPQLSLSGDKLWYIDIRGDTALVSRYIDDGSVALRAAIDLPPNKITGGSSRLGPPYVADGTVYAAGALAEFTRRGAAPVYALDAKNGSERWRYEPPGLEGDLLLQLFGSQPTVGPEEIEELSPFSAAYGYPLVVDDHVLVTVLGDFGADSVEDLEHLVAIRPDDGTAAWHVPVESVSFAPVAAGSVVYLVTMDGIEVISTDGDHLDRATRVGMLAEFSPAIGFGGLFAPARDGMVAFA